MIVYIRKSICVLILSVFLAFPRSVFADSIDAYIVDIERTPENALIIEEQLILTLTRPERERVRRILPTRILQKIGSIEFPSRVEYQIESLKLDGEFIPWSSELLKDSVSVTTEALLHATGSRRLVLRYSVKNRLQHGITHSRLVWRQLWNDWQFLYQVGHVKKAIIRYRGVPINDAYCFNMRWDTPVPSCQFQKSTTSSEILAEASQGLQTNQAFIADIRFPPEKSNIISFVEQAHSFVKNNGIVASILLSIIVLCIAWYAFLKNFLLQRYAKIEPTPPENYPPSYIGAVYHGGINVNCIIGTIVSLVQKNVITWKEAAVEEGILLTYDQRAENERSKLYSHEITLIDRLFANSEKSVNLSTLSDEALESIVRQVSAIVHQELVALRIFYPDIKMRRLKWILLGGVFIAVSWFFDAFVYLFLGLFMIASGGNMSILSLDVGQNLREHVYGFTRFLLSDQHGHSTFDTASFSTESEYEALLPWAVAIGVESKWAAASHEGGDSSLYRLVKRLRSRFYHSPNHFTAG